MEVRFSYLPHLEKEECVDEALRDNRPQPSVAADGCLCLKRSNRI
jgi:hypothetical protein